MSHQASDGSLFRPTGRPLPVIGINTNQNLIHPGLFQGIVPGKDSLAKPPLAHTLVFKDVKKCEGESETRPSPPLMPTLPLADPAAAPADLHGVLPPRGGIC